MSEQFPSLSGITTHADGSIYWCDVEELLIDKQRVREILKDYLENGSFDQKIICQRLIKELGL
jgi:hypothetical protein